MEKLTPIVSKKLELSIVSKKSSTVSRKLPTLNKKAASTNLPAIEQEQPEVKSYIRASKERSCLCRALSLQPSWARERLTITGCWVWWAWRGHTVSCKLRATQLQTPFR